MTADIAETIDSLFGKLERIAADLWSHPELSGQEQYAAGRLKRFLAEQNFTIQDGLIPDLPTSFLATWGSGKPVIGFLGEYDALPGCSQAVCSRPAPLVDGGAGHGCGHNLLGTGLAGAAAVAKALLKNSGQNGTLRFYGCPAEETLLGKVLMDRAHLFDDCDVCLSWHPMGFTCVSDYIYSALTSIQFCFSGTAAHAAESPDQGRSALDAVELMNVGANYLREHIPRGTQLHYTITQGGFQPNIVPDKAQSWYYVRAPRQEQVFQVAERLFDVARGAALMTGTQASWQTVTSCSHTRLNPTLNRLLYRCMTETPYPRWDEADTGFAQAIRDTLDPEFCAKLLQRYGMQELEGLALHDQPSPLKPSPVRMAGSSDYSNVSLRVPCGQVFVSCCPPGTPAHSWQMTACAGSQLGIKAMRYAVEVLTRATLSLLFEPEQLAMIREDDGKTEHI